MRKKREFIEGAYYHVTSRTNDKIRIFENNLGRKIMLIVLQDAKSKFRFRLANFCVMPTHIHLLIEPGEGTNLSMTMQWIKTKSAKWWNKAHGSKDHVWGDRYFARAVKDPIEYEFIMNYIDKNPVVAGLAAEPAEWQASAAYYKARGIAGLVDGCLDGCQSPVTGSIPELVAKLLPPAQLAHTMQYFGAYAEAVDRLEKIAQKIPPPVIDTGASHPPCVSGTSASHYLHYFTGSADYFICEYDGDDVMYGKVRFSVFPGETHYQQFSLTKLKSNRMLELDFGWVPDKSD